MITRIIHPVHTTPTKWSIILIFNMIITHKMIHSISTKKIFTYYYIETKFLKQYLELGRLWQTGLCLWNSATGFDKRLCLLTGWLFHTGCFKFVYNVPWQLRQDCLICILENISIFGAMLPGKQLPFVIIKSVSKWKSVERWCECSSMPSLPA